MKNCEDRLFGEGGSMERISDQIKSGDVLTVKRKKGSKPLSLHVARVYVSCSPIPIFANDINTTDLEGKELEERAEAGKAQVSNG